jgi:hypothetical protein
VSETILQEAQRLVHGDRQADYGHPLDDFTRTAAMWAAILGHPVTAEQVGLCMIAVKVSRQCNHPKRDNMTDAAGYSATVQMCIEERARRADLARLSRLPEPSPLPPVGPPIVVREPPIDEPE